MTRHPDEPAHTWNWRGILSWLWQILVVLMISLALIWLGSRLPSEQPSPDEAAPLQHYVCISVEAGTSAQCRLSVLVPQPLPPLP